MSALSHDDKLWVSFHSADGTHGHATCLNDIDDWTVHNKLTNNTDKVLALPVLLILIRRIVITDNKTNKELVFYDLFKINVIHTDLKSFSSRMVEF